MPASLANEDKATIINETDVELEYFCRIWEQVCSTLLEQAIDLELYKAQHEDNIVPMLTYMLTYAVKEEVLLQDFYNNRG